MSLLASFVMLAFIGYANWCCLVQVIGVCRRRRPCVVRQPRPMVYGAKL